MNNLFTKCKSIKNVSACTAESYLPQMQEITGLNGSKRCLKAEIALFLGRVGPVVQNNTHRRLSLARQSRHVIEFIF